MRLLGYLMWALSGSMLALGVWTRHYLRREGR